MERQGFFTKKEIESKSRPDGKSHSCASCGLYKTAHTPRMKPFGNFKKGIMNIGEAPGEMEDKYGKPWQGKTGRLLKDTYARLGIDLFEDCINVNACHCRPMDAQGNNRAPTNAEVENCRKTTLSYISQYKPKIIILLGNAAVYSLLAHRWKKDFGGISKWRGWNIPDQDLQTWVCPTFHPSYVHRADAQEIESVWINDLKASLSLLVDYKFPVYKEPEIEIINDLSVLDNITEGSVAFDYETTGKKPHAKGHRVVCCSVANSENHAYVFMIPEKRSARQPLINLLTRKSVGKIAQNMKFEETWSVVRLKQSIIDWEWDTMIATHLLDNRPGVTGLKFQSYVQFGIIDYSSEIEPYLHANNDGNGNSINRIDELLKLPGGREKLLHYCALDAVYEYRLAKWQQSEILLPF